MGFPGWENILGDIGSGALDVIGVQLPKKVNKFGELDLARSRQKTMLLRGLLCNLFNPTVLFYHKSARAQILSRAP